MALWRWLGDSAGVLLLIVLLYGLALIVRRRWLARAGGTFELSVRTGARLGGAGWVLGVGRYVDDALEWYRVFSLWPRPRRVFHRHEIELREQRQPADNESHALYAGHVVAVLDVASRTGGEAVTETVELALSPASLTGLQSWLEAAPPSDPAVKRR